METSFKIFIEKASQDYSKLSIEPLARGYGDTLGNALRRLLLSSIKGAAATALRLDGVLHEFSTIKGVREDVIEILMNLKHIPIKAKNDLPAGEYKILTLDSEDLGKDFFTREVNPGIITAQDLNTIYDTDFEFVGNGILCTLEPGAHVIMEIYIQQGVGYLSAERERPAQPPMPLDAMLADAIFSPVTRVNYEIEPARVDQSIDYERLILEVWTNGAITPKEAVKQAADIAADYFMKISESVESAQLKEQPAEVEKVRDKAGKGKGTEEAEQPKPQTLPDNPIHELELSIRSENCLLRGGMNTIGDLIQKSRDDLLKIRNLGRKSLTEIEEKLASMGYSLKPSKPGAAKVDDSSESESPETQESEVTPESEPTLDSIFEPEEESEPAPEPEAKPEKPKKKNSAGKSTKSSKKSSKEVDS